MAATPRIGAMSVEVWTSAAFRAEAEAWVAESLRPLGVRLTGRA